MADELPGQIEEILRDAKGDPLLKKEIHEKLQASYGYMGSERKVERTLVSLKEEGLAEPVHFQAKRKGKTFTTVGWIHSSAIIEKGTGSEAHLDKIRLSHTEAIKEKVIKPWIEQLPDISIDGLYKIVMHKGESLFQKFAIYGYEKLEVEDELLFEDFKKHVSFDPNPFRLLKELKFKTNLDLFFLSLQFQLTAKKHYPITF